MNEVKGEKETCRTGFKRSRGAIDPCLCRLKSLPFSMTENYE